jgi:hypothetical protein
METYQQRVIEEKAQLDERLKALRAFRKAALANIVVPARELELLGGQELAMSMYSRALADRISYFPKD